MNAQNTLANAAAAAQPVPLAVPSAVQHLDKATENLHEAISELERRLGPVLSPLPPAGVGETAKLARHSLALQIDAGATSVDHAAGRIAGLINRLEL